MSSSSEIPAVVEAASTPANNPSGAAHPVNPNITSVHLEIQNSERIKNLAREFADMTFKTQEVSNTDQNDWFSRFNVANNMECAQGDHFIIDVQPDMRDYTAYIIYCAIKIYPLLDIKSNPTVSLFSLIAYLQIVFSAYLLSLDDITRGVRSLWCNEYHNDHERHDYLRTLLGCNVPREITILISKLATVYDPSKPNCVFVPSFAGGKFSQDYGRLVPPQIFLLMHNALYRMRNNIVVDEIRRQLHATTVITVNQFPYIVSHFIGGMFLQNQANTQHANWVNRLIDTIFVPSCGRTHQARPTFAEIPITAQVVNETSPNFYDFMTCYNDDDFPVIKSFMETVSAFLQNSEINCDPLAVTVSNASGITTLSHSIETMCLPTWHFLAAPTATVTSDKVVTNFDDSKYATHIKFLVHPKKFTGTFKCPADRTSFCEKLMLVSKDKFDADTYPVIHQLFSRYHYINPDVFVFQPYERNTSRASLAMTLGIKIESNEIDATIIPLPNIDDNLHDNNSCYIQGSIPEYNIRAVIPRTDENHAIRLIERELMSYEIAGFALRNGGANVLPIFANQGVNQVDMTGFHREENFCDPNEAFTYTAWRHNHNNDIAERSRFIWSSYRHVTNSNKANRAVHFYYTMRAMYGTSVPLTRIRNPAILFPRL